MATLLQLMQPYLQTVHPEGTEYGGDGAAILVVTLPKIHNLHYRKTQTLVFDGPVVEALQAAAAVGDTAVIDRVGDYICNVLSERFRHWNEANVQIPRFHVGSEALDQ